MTTNHPIAITPSCPRGVKKAGLPIPGLFVRLLVTGPPSYVVTASDLHSVASKFATLFQHISALADTNIVTILSRSIALPFTKSVL